MIKNFIQLLTMVLFFGAQSLAMETDSDSEEEQSFSRVHPKGPGQLDDVYVSDQRLSSIVKVLPLVGVGCGICLELYKGGSLLSIVASAGEGLLYGFGGALLVLRPFTDRFILEDGTGARPGNPVMVFVDTYCWWLKD